jgi:hypothetical protein
MKIALCVKSGGRQSNSYTTGLARAYGSTGGLESHNLETARLISPSYSQKRILAPGLPGREFCSIWMKTVNFGSRRHSRAAEKTRRFRQ